MYIRFLGHQVNNPIRFHKLKNTAPNKLTSRETRAR